jgi:hypothetical protein
MFLRYLLFTYAPHVSSCRSDYFYLCRVFLAKRDQIVLYYDTFQCEAYPFGTLTCHLSGWSIALLLIALLLLLTLIGVLIFLNVHFRSQVRHVKSHDVTDL